MQNTWFVGVVIVSMAGLFTLPAVAQDASEGEGKAAQLFREADANGDGSVTLDELKSVLPGMTQERFDTLDRNGDGVLTREDLRAGGAGAAGARGAGQMLARLQEADTNGDQKITPEEAKAAFPRMTDERFKRFDRNGDGVISREDFEQAMASEFERADTNGDGKLSLDEARSAFPRMTEEMFKRLDRDADGFLSPEDRNE